MPEERASVAPACQRSRRRFLLGLFATGAVVLSGRLEAAEWRTQTIMRGEALEPGAGLRVPIEGSSGGGDELIYRIHPRRFPQRRLKFSLKREGPPEALPGASVGRGELGDLELYNVHTDQTLLVRVERSGVYSAQDRQTIDYFMRDWREAETRRFDTRLLTALWQIQEAVNSKHTIHVLSAYRTKKTNDMLRLESNRVALNSFHLKAQAIDFRIPSESVSSLAAEARGLRLGGVGQYVANGFVHLDTGPVRSWG